ncbi:MAG TPA: VOC family protein [Streptosporangiaceae bacterium]|nr:VOC family protein [Streptosporangiaceae bacterium]
MAEGIRLSGAVMFVRNLDRSVSFYRELLGLQETDRSPTAALLVNDDGSQLVLRATGQNAPHALGAIGPQYLTWTTSSKDDLDQLAGTLRAHSAYRETRTDGEVSVVEGRDPDDLVVLLIYAGPGTNPMPRLPARIYAW